MDSSLSSFLNELKILSDKLYLFELNFLNNLETKLSHSELRVIVFVGSAGKCILSDVCKNTGIKKNNLTAIYKDLFAKGFISRAKTDDDKRVMFISLSRTGKAVFDEYLKSREIYFKEILDNDNLYIITNGLNL